MYSFPLQREFRREPAKVFSIVLFLSFFLLVRKNQKLFPDSLERIRLASSLGFPGLGMSTEKLKEKCVNYYKKLKKKSSKCRVKDLRKFAINIVARPVIISHAQRWNRYTIPHRCSARNTCIHCNMCNNARLETRKIGLHFCGTSPYTREPHQLLFTGAEPERLISHHQGRAVPVRLTELCRSNDINNKKLIRYID